LGPRQKLTRLSSITNPPQKSLRIFATTSCLANIQIIFIQYGPTNKNPQNFTYYKLLAKNQCLHLLHPLTKIHKISSTTSRLAKIQFFSTIMSPQQKPTIFHPLWACHQKSKNISSIMLANDNSKNLFFKP